MRSLWAALAISLSFTQATDADFTTFLRHFRTAVAAGDGAAIASLTVRPFLFNGKQLDSAEFARRASELFDDKVRRCFPFARPIAEDDAMTLSCDPYIFYFRVVGGLYRLAEFTADPESEPNAASEPALPAQVTFATTYDIRTEPFRHPWFFGPIAAAMLLVAVLLFVRAVRQERSRRGAYLVLILTVVFGGVTIGLPFWDRQRLIRHLTDGTARSAEGRVTAHEAREVRVPRSGEKSKSTIRTWEAFEVGGVRFGFYRQVDQAGFHNSAEQRQELNDGMLVRVRYVEDKPGEAAERRILVIETAPSP